MTQPRRDADPRNVMGEKNDPDCQLAFDTPGVGTRGDPEWRTARPQAHPHRD